MHGASTGIMMAPLRRDLSLINQLQDKSQGAISLDNHTKTIFAQSKFVNISQPLTY